MSTSVIIMAKTNLHRAAWRSLLKRQPGIVVLGAAGRVAEMAALLETQQNVAILVDLPDVHAELVDQLRSTLPECGLLFLVENYEFGGIVDLLHAGAIGIMERDVAVADLARGIIAVGRGEIVLPPDLATRALVALARGEAVQEASPAALTSREQEVLKLLAQGFTNSCTGLHQ
jgi:DNA-binding NarL/FixJ family response regulator